MASSAFLMIIGLPVTDTIPFKFFWSRSLFSGLWLVEMWILFRFWIVFGVYLESHAPHIGNIFCPPTCMQNKHRNLLLFFKHRYFSGWYRTCFLSLNIPASVPSSFTLHHCKPVYNSVPSKSPCLKTTTLFLPYSKLSGIL